MLIIVIIIIIIILSSGHSEGGTGKETQKESLES